MAVIDTLGQPYPDFNVVERANYNIITNRFPTPPIARGFCGVVEEAVATPLAVMPWRPPIVNALAPVPVYLEPTIGQIWPQ